MGYFIDRRVGPKGKSAGNRGRFIRRYKQQLKETVDKLATTRSIRDNASAPVEVEISKKDISEPSFRHGDDGRHEPVLPGNREYSAGDRIEKPPGGGEDAGGEGGEGADSFTFTLSADEFLKLYFDDMELPNHVDNLIADMTEMKVRQAGYSKSGSYSRLSLNRTFRQALSRRIAQRGALNDEIQALHDAVGTPEADDEVLRLEERRDRIPFIDEDDLRFRALIQFPQTSWRAVMFCLMDVSGSMDEHCKDLAKRFFTLLYLFLSRKYANVELVFVRHTEVAEECDEKTFFFDRLSGGTRVLAALEKMKEIVKKRFGDEGWNVYGAQASDGDAFGTDAEDSANFLKVELLPLSRHFCYLEVHSPAYASLGNGGTSSLWQAYSSISHPRFASREAGLPEDVYPALRSIFKKAAIA